MAKILLVEQHATRSFDSLIVIEEYLRRMGHQVDLSLSGNPLKEKILRWQPELIYMPWVAPRFVEFLEEQKARPLLLNSYQEQNQLLDKGKTFPYVRKMMEDTPHLFCWGDVYGKRAQELNPDLEYQVTGVTRYDNYLDENIRSVFIKSKKELAKEYGIPYDTKWVLVAYDYALLFKPKRIERALKLGLKTQDYITKSWEALHRLGDWLREVAPRNPDVSFILRPHPGSPLHKLQAEQQLQNCPNVFYNSEGPINQWILSADKYLTRLSSSILEAWIANKDTASLFPDLRTTAVQGYLHLQECKETIATPEELQAYLDRPLSTDNLEAHRSFLEATFGKLDGKACWRTAQGIHKIALAEKDNLGSQQYGAVDGRQIMAYRLQNGFRKFLLETQLIKVTPWRNKPMEYVSDRYLREKRQEVSAALKMEEVQRSMVLENEKEQ